MLQYAFILAVMPALDNQGAILQLVQGVFNNLAERDVTGSGVNRVVGRYVLNGVTPERTANVWLGFGVQSRSDELAASDRAQIEAVSTFQNVAVMQTIFTPPPTPITREWVVTRQKQMAKEHGCTHAWVLQPGDSTTVANAADLLARFQPL